MAKHATLSASAAHRWLKCTPSARLEQDFPDTTSEAAREGTLAHEMCELKLINEFIKPMTKSVFTRSMNKLRKAELYDPEMEEHTDFYIDYIKSIYGVYEDTPYINAEKKVDFSEIVPEGFGTCDCVLICGTEMHIVDFKYGKGVPVDAEKNPQLMLYALGALIEYSMLYDIQTVSMHIVQPRLDRVSKAVLTKEALLAWAQDIKPVALKAFNGEGEFMPSEEACRFCRAKAQCRARADKNLALAKEDFKAPELLTDEEIGKVLELSKDLKSWVSDVEEYALSKCLAGGDIPGFKAVEGRSTRAFADQDKAFEILMANGVEEALLYERKPLTLAKVEKMVGKKEFAEMVGDYIIKPPGKPTLAPASDKRQAVTLKSTAEEDFGVNK